MLHSSQLDTPDANVDPIFIGQQVRSLSQDILASCAKSGTTVDSIDFERLKAVSVRIPPLLEQTRVVAKIDSLFRKIAPGSRKPRPHSSAC